MQLEMKRVNYRKKNKGKWPHNVRKTNFWKYINSKRKVVVVVIVCITSHVSSSIEQRHLQPSEAVVGHRPVWSVAAVDDMKHCWIFATLTLVTLCKAHFLWQDAQWPWLVWKWFILDQYHCGSPSNPGCWILGSFIHNGRVDHPGRLPVILLLTGDFCNMSVYLEWSGSRPHCIMYMSTEKYH